MLDRIGDARIGKPIEEYGPESLGPPVRIDMSNMAHIIGAAAVDLDELRNRIDAMTPRQQGEVYTKARAFKSLALELVEAVDAALLEQCEMGREPLVETADGLKRLYATNEKTIKCRDAKATLASLLEQHGPDVAAQALASNAFKQGACKALLGDEWPNHFEVIERNKLAEGGAPKRRLTLARNAEEIGDE